LCCCHHLPCRNFSPVAPKYLPSNWMGLLVLPALLHAPLPVLALEDMCCRTRTGPRVCWHYRYAVRSHRFNGAVKQIAGRVCSPAGILCGFLKNETLCGASLPPPLCAPGATCSWTGCAQHSCSRCRHRSKRVTRAERGFATTCCVAGARARARATHPRQPFPTPLRTPTATRYYPIPSPPLRSALCHTVPEY